MSLTSLVPLISFHHCIYLGKKQISSLPTKQEKKGKCSNRIILDSLKLQTEKVDGSFSFMISSSPEHFLIKTWLEKHTWSSSEWDRREGKEKVSQSQQATHTQTLRTHSLTRTRYDREQKSTRHEKKSRKERINIVLTSVLWIHAFPYMLPYTSYFFSPGISVISATKGMIIIIITAK